MATLLPPNVIGTAGSSGSNQAEVAPLPNPQLETIPQQDRGDASIAMAVFNVNVDGTYGVALANESLDQVTIQNAAGPSQILGDQNDGIRSPDAVTLADLNGDGIPDLVIANSGGDNVLIYPGLGDGQFGADVNGGKGFQVGTNPVGITVADLDGDGQPDLIVADKGSNDASVLINQTTFSTHGVAGPALGEINFGQGPTIRPGLGPVAIAYGDFSGTGQFSLAVADSGSNDVMVFTSQGNGSWSDQPSQVVPVGDDPVALLPMNIDGTPALVSVNSGSNTLSLITDLGGAQPHVSTISSGGLDPVAAVSWGAGGSGGLVVANKGNGSLALFLPSNHELTLRTSQIVPGLPSPDALAIVGLRAGELDVLAANSGRASATLVPFTLADNPPAPRVAPSVAVLNVRQQLQPLRQSDVALVSTLLPVSVEISSVASEPTNFTQPSIAVSGASTSILGQSVVATKPGGARSPTGALEPIADPELLLAWNLADAPAAGETSPSLNYFSGVDEAIEQIHRESLERNNPSPRSAEAGLRPPNNGDQLTIPKATSPRRTQFPANPGVPVDPPALGLTAPDEHASPSGNTHGDVLPGELALGVRQSLDALTSEERLRMPLRTAEANRQKSNATSVIIALAALTPVVLADWLGDRLRFRALRPFRSERPRPSPTRRSPAP
jgi:hypothetical protein